MHCEACCFICYNAKPSLICPSCFGKTSCELRDLLHAKERGAQLADQLEAAVATKVSCNESFRGRCGARCLPSRPLNTPCVQERQEKQSKTLAGLRDSLATARSRTKGAKSLKVEGEQPVVAYLSLLLCHSAASLARLTTTVITCSQPEHQTAAEQQCSQEGSAPEMHNRGMLVCHRTSTFGDLQQSTRQGIITVMQMSTSHSQLKSGA